MSSSDKSNVFEYFRLNKNDSNTSLRLVVHVGYIVQISDLVFPGEVGILSANPNPAKKNALF